MHAQTFTHFISVRINDVRMQMVLVHAYSVWEGNWFCTNRPIQLFKLKLLSWSVRNIFKNNEDIYIFFSLYFQSGRWAFLCHQIGTDRS